MVVKVFSLLSCFQFIYIKEEKDCFSLTSLWRSMLNVCLVWCDNLFAALEKMIGGNEKMQEATKQKRIKSGNYFFAHIRNFQTCPKMIKGTPFGDKRIFWRAQKAFGVDQYFI